MARLSEAELMDQLRSISENSISEQKNALAMQEQNLADFAAAPQQIDLSPLIAFADSWNGSNLGSSYSKPQSPQARAQTIAQMEQMINNSRRGVTDQEIELIGEQLGYLAKRDSASQKPMKSGQYAAAQFAARSENAERALMDLMSEYDPTTLKETGLALLPEQFKTQNRKKFNQLLTEFVSGILRKESGAAIPDDELRRYEKLFFPQPGDKEEVIAQKANSRRLAIAGLRAEAGPALDEVKRELVKTSIDQSLNAFNPPVRKENPVAQTQSSGWADKLAGFLGTSGQEQTLKPGTIEDGYRFLGGDRKDPKNWEALK